jgi:hypothetical protein
VTLSIWTLPPLLSHDLCIIILLLSASFLNAGFPQPSKDWWKEVDDSPFGHWPEMVWYCGGIASLAGPNDTINRNTDFTKHRRFIVGVDLQKKTKKPETVKKSPGPSALYQQNGGGTRILEMKSKLHHRVWPALIRGLPSKGTLRAN